MVQSMGIKHTQRLSYALRAQVEGTKPKQMRSDEKYRICPKSHHTFNSVALCVILLSNNVTRKHTGG